MLAGVGAGLVSTVCMHPLDMLKVQYQVSTKGVGGIVGSLRRIASGPDGARALYRGLSPNLVGNASSWGFYFLWSVISLGDCADDQVHADQSAHGRRRSVGPSQRRPAPARLGLERRHHRLHDQPALGREDAHVHLVAAGRSAARGPVPRRDRRPDPAGARGGDSRPVSRQPSRARRRIEWGDPVHVLRGAQAADAGSQAAQARRDDARRRVRRRAAQQSRVHRPQRQRQALLDRLHLSVRRPLRRRG